MRFCGCKVRMADALMRTVLQTAWPEKDHKQQRGVTPCREAQRTTIFCSAGCSTAGVGVREGQMPRFWELLPCQLLCLASILDSVCLGEFWLFSPARHESEQWPSSNQTCVTAGRKSSWKAALLAWNGHTRSSPDVLYSVIVPVHLQCCSWARTWSGSCCRGHRKDEEGFALLHCSFYKRDFTFSCLSAIPVCDAKLKQISQPFSLVLSASDPISWQHSNRSGGDLLHSKGGKITCPSHGENVSSVGTSLHPD